MLLISYIPAAFVSAVTFELTGLRGRNKFTSFCHRVHIQLTDLAMLTKVKNRLCICPVTQIHSQISWPLPCSMLHPHTKFHENRAGRFSNNPASKHTKQSWKHNLLGAGTVLCSQNWIWIERKGGEGGLPVGAESLKENLTVCGSLRDSELSFIHTN